MNFLLGAYTSLLPGHLASALACPPCRQTEWPFKVINPVMSLTPLKCFIGFPFRLGKSPDALPCPQGKIQLLGPSLTAFLVSHPQAPIVHSTFLTVPETWPDSFYLWVSVFALLDTVLHTVEKGWLFHNLRSPRQYDFLTGTFPCLLPFSLISQNTLICSTITKHCLVYTYVFLSVSLT